MLSPGDRQIDRAFCVDDVDAGRVEAVSLGDFQMFLHRVAGRIVGAIQQSRVHMIGEGVHERGIQVRAVGRLKREFDADLSLSLLAEPLVNPDEPNGRNVLREEDFRCGCVRDGVRERVGEGAVVRGRRRGRKTRGERESRGRLQKSASLHGRFLFFGSMGNSVDVSVRTIPFRLSAGDRPVFSVYFQFLPNALGLRNPARSGDRQTAPRRVGERHALEHPLLNGRQ